MSDNPTKKNASIQGLRALAVILVICYHYGAPVRNGFIGVDVFFVISGFVITQSLLRYNSGNRWKDLRLFYTKRIARLFPAFFCVFVFTMLAIFLFYSPNVGIQQNAIKGGLGAIFAISNFLIPRISGGYFSVESGTNPFLHTWSLSVEEQFYFIYPILFFLIAHLARPVNRKLKINSILIFFILISFSLTLGSLPFSKFGSLGTLQYFAPQSRAWEFLTGSLVAFNPPIFHRMTTLAKERFRLVLALFIILFSLFFTFDANGALFWIVIPVITSALFLSLSAGGMNLNNHQKPNPFSKFWNYSGDLSYSLYLWHWPIYVSGLIIFPDSPLYVAIISLILTVLASSISYHFIEQKFNYERKQRKHYWFKTILSGQLTSILIILLLFAGVTSGWNRDWTLNSHKVLAVGCGSGLIDFNKCSWKSSKSSDSIYLVGDSMSWAIADGVIVAAGSMNLNFQSLSRNGCAITKVSINGDGDCDAWRKRVINILLKEKPLLVGIANSAGYSDHELLGMGELVRLLNLNGIKVVFFLPPPGGDAYSGRRALFYRPGAESRTSPKPELTSMQKYGLLNYSNAMQFIVYDPSIFLCTRRCVIAKNGKDYYTYGAHLSVYGDSQLTASIQNTFEKLL